MGHPRLRKQFTQTGLIGNLSDGDSKILDSFSRGKFQNCYLLNPGWQSSPVYRFYSGYGYACNQSLDLPVFSYCPDLLLLLQLVMGKYLWITANTERSNTLE